MNLNMRHPITKTRQPFHLLLGGGIVLRSREREKVPKADEGCWGETNPWDEGERYQTLVWTN
jgi:hypothetical protein